MLKYKNYKQSQKGFNLLETMIAIVVGAIILSGGISLIVSTVKKGKFVQKTFDTKTSLNQKNSQLLNNAANELAKILTNQTSAGSINPEQPLAGYFDLLNESGCVVNAAIGLSSPTEPTKDVANKGKLGDLGNGDSGSTNLDCSISANSSGSTIPMFRRQWIINKDFPSKGDTSFSVVVVAIQTNQIVMSSSITKSDGVTIR